MVKAVVRNVVSQEETLALLKILAIGNQQATQGRATPVAEVVNRLRVQSQDGCRRRGWPCLCGKCLCIGEPEH